MPDMQWITQLLVTPKIMQTHSLTLTNCNSAPPASCVHHVSGWWVSNYGRWRHTSSPLCSVPGHHGHERRGAGGLAGGGGLAAVGRPPVQPPAPRLPHLPGHAPPALAPHTAPRPQHSRPYTQHLPRGWWVTATGGFKNQCQPHRPSLMTIVSGS